MGLALRKKSHRCWSCRSTSCGPSIDCALYYTTHVTLPSYSPNLQTAHVQANTTNTKYGGSPPLWLMPLTMSLVPFLGWISLQRRECHIIDRSNSELRNAVCKYCMHVSPWNSLRKNLWKSSVIQKRAYPKQWGQQHQTVHAELQKSLQITSEK